MIKVSTNPMKRPETAMDGSYLQAKAYFQHVLQMKPQNPSFIYALTLWLTCSFNAIDMATIAFFFFESVPLTVHCAAAKNITSAQMCIIVWFIAKNSPQQIHFFRHKCTVTFARSFFIYLFLAILPLFDNEGKEGERERVMMCNKGAGIIPGTLQLSAS